MKKTLLFAAAILALAACSKENTVKEEGPIDASKIVFNIQVENADATKAVKKEWAEYDEVFVFFEDNTTQYVKMTYNGTSWEYTDNDDETNFTGLTLAASGKLSAVFMPGIVYHYSTPTYNAGKWTFGSIGGYFQTAESVDYTVTSTDDVTTLNATLSLTAPANISQVFIPLSEPPIIAMDTEIVLTATHIFPFIFSGIAPGGAASWETTSNGFPLTSYYDPSNIGYYFWGILESAGEYDFTFQLVERNADKKYAISSKSKSVHATVGSNFAAKLSGLTDNGKFVSLGYAGGPLWATGNLDKTYNKIVDPLLPGEYFMYGKTTPYVSSDAMYTGTDNPLLTSADAAYQVNNDWRIPTKAQFDALIDASNTETVWKTGWTILGSDNGGRLITSKVNGISLFFAAAGLYVNGSLNYAGDYGLYWSSTPYDSDHAYDLYFRSGDIYTGSSSRGLGYSVRPVKN